MRIAICSAALVLLAGAVASFFPFVLKWSIGRTRPYRGVWSWQLAPFRPAAFHAFLPS